MLSPDWAILKPTLRGGKPMELLAFICIGVVIAVILAVVVTLILAREEYKKQQKKPP